MIVYYPRLGVMIMALPAYFADKLLLSMIPGMGPGGALTLKWFDAYLPRVNTTVQSPAAIQSAPSPSLPARSPSPTEFKIPRPRNAWIIFRQAHHKQAAAQNPGKTNNELCKFMNTIHYT
jgi:hypothetical protein